MNNPFDYRPNRDEFAIQVQRNPITMPIRVLTEEQWKKEKTRMAIGFILAILSSAVSGFILGWFSRIEWIGR